MPASRCPRPHDRPQPTASCMQSYRRQRTTSREESPGRPIELTNASHVQGGDGDTTRRTSERGGKRSFIPVRRSCRCRMEIERDREAGAGDGDRWGASFVRLWSGQVASPPEEGKSRSEATWRRASLRVVEISSDGLERRASFFVLAGLDV